MKANTNFRINRKRNTKDFIGFIQSISKVCKEKKSLIFFKLMCSFLDLSIKLKLLKCYNLLLLLRLNKSLNRLIPKELIFSCSSSKFEHK